MKIGIVNYGCNNIANIVTALNKVGQKCEIIEKKKDLAKFEKIILPGIGSAEHAM